MVPLCPCRLADLKLIFGEKQDKKCYKRAENLENSLKLDKITQKLKRTENSHKEKNCNQLEKLKIFCPV